MQVFVYGCCRLLVGGGGGGVDNGQRVLVGGCWTGGGGVGVRWAGGWRMSVWEMGGSLPDVCEEDVGERMEVVGWPALHGACWIEGVGWWMEEDGRRMLEGTVMEALFVFCALSLFSLYELCVCVWGGG